MIEEANLVILLFLGFMHSAVTVDTDDLWSDFHVEMAKAMGFASPTDVQFVNNGDAGKPFNYTSGFPVDRALIDFVNRQPWSPDGINTEFYSEYRDMVLHGLLTPQLASHSTEIDELADQLNAIAKDISQRQLELVDAYNTLKDANAAFGLETVDGNTYLTQNGFYDYVATKHLEQQNINTQIRALTNTELSEIAQAQFDVDDVSYQVFTTAPNDNPNININNTLRPEWTISPTPEEYLANLKALSLNELTVTIKRDTTHSFFKEDKFGGGASFGGFFSFGASVSGDISTTIEDDTSFLMTIKLNEWARIQVKPGGWFDQAVLPYATQQELINQDVIKWVPFTDDKTQPAFFGPYGTINSMITELIVASDVDISLTMSESSFKEVKSHFEESASFGIGCFKISLGSTSQDKDIVDTDATSNTVAIKFKSDIPQIIGLGTTVLNKARDPFDEDDEVFQASSNGGTSNSSIPSGAVGAIVFLTLALTVALSVIGVMYVRRKKVHGNYVEMGGEYGRPAQVVP